MEERPTKPTAVLRARLNESLFLASPKGQTTTRTWKHLGLGLTLLALAVILQLLRVGLSNALNSLWAEDGQIFLQGAMDQGFFHAVFSTYAGYLVFVPRLIGEIAAAVPLRDAPAAVAIAAGIVVALSGLAVWYASAAYIRNPYLRGTLVALTILVPVANLESVASGAYVSWYMLFATFWLLLWRPATTRGAVLGSLFILATGLSSPGVWFFAPIVVLRAVAARDRRDLMIVGSFAIGAAVQIPVIALNHEAAVTPLWTSDIWTTYIQRVVDGAAFGERLGGAAWAHFGWTFLVALLACAVVGLAIGLRRATPTARYIAAIAIPTSLVMFVVSVYQRAVGTQMMWPPGTHFGNGGRYAIVPALLLVSVALVLIDRSSAKWRGPSGLPWVGMAATSLLLLGLAGSFDVSNAAGRGAPPWDDALKSAAATCAAKDLSETTVPTSPPGFGVVIPCDHLSSFSGAPSAR